MSNRRRPTRPPGPARPPLRGRTRSWRSVTVAASLAFVIGALLAGWAAYTASRPDPVQAEVHKLQAQDAARDKEQTRELTATARETQGKLLPVVADLAAALPVDPQTPPKPATAVQVSSWRAVTRAAVERFAHPPSGGTAVNVARSGLSDAVRALDVAVRVYETSLSAPPATKARLVALAAEQRNIAIATWSTAATQLDVVNNDQGFGHAHVFLPAAPGTGALTADTEPEGHSG